MPYVRPPITNADKMRRLLLGYGLTPPRLAKVFGCSETTARKRLEDPNLITTAEWRMVNRIGHVPVEEIREVFLS